MAEQPKRLYRSRSDRQLTGVLGGVAEYFGLDPSWVRIGYVLVAAFTGGIPGVLLYIAMALIVPAAPEAGGPEATAEQEEAS
jgi:phage shock protein C